MYYSLFSAFKSISFLHVHVYLEIFIYFFVLNNKKKKFFRIYRTYKYMVHFFFQYKKTILNTCTRHFKNKTLNALIINRKKSALLWWRKLLMSIKLTAATLWLGKASTAISSVSTWCPSISESTRHSYLKSLASHGDSQPVRYWKVHTSDSKNA